MISRYLRALRGRSPAELRDRAYQNIFILLERGGFLTGQPIVEPARPVRMPNSPREAGFARDFNGRWPTEAAEIVATADRIMLGKFDLLGYTGIDWGVSPDWQLDPVSGKRAPMKHWSRVPYLDIQSVGDHKVTWELNRHQWMVTLAQAWCLTGNDVYALRTAELLDLWIENNPPKHGINWASSLELGFRSIAWCHTLKLLEEAAAPDDTLRRRMLESLHLQGEHIERYLSTWFSPNTHLTGEALALLYLGTALPSLPRAARWRELGWEILLNESKRQIRDDGVYFEQTTWYQGYTVDFYLHAIRLRRSAGGSVPAELIARVRSAVEVIASIVRPDGTIPLLGDDDGGRLLPLRPRARNDFRDTLALAAVVLDDPSLMPAASEPRSTLAWILTPEELAATEKAEVNLDRPAAQAFPDGGLYVIRDSRSHLLLDAGPHGALSGAHSHADALSLVLSVDGRPALCDSGTYTYLGSERDSFRGTSAHNTVEVSGRMSSEPGNGFRWETFARSEVLRWYDSPAFVLWEAIHDGYQRLPNPVTHRRIVFWLRDQYGLVCDVLESSGTSESSAVTRWHGPAGANMQLLTPASAALADESGPLLGLLADRELGIAVGKASTSYGRSEVVDVASSEWYVRERGASVTALVPGASPDGPVSCHEIAANSGSAWGLRGTDWSDIWMVSSGATMNAAGVETSADVLWLRRNGNGQAVELMAAGTGVVLVDDIEVLSVRGGCVRARQGENGNWTVEEI